MFFFHCDYSMQVRKCTKKGNDDFLFPHKINCPQRLKLRDVVHFLSSGSSLLPRGGDAPSASTALDAVVGVM